MQTIELIQIGAAGLPLVRAGKLNDVATQVCAATAVLYRATGFVPPWIGYLACIDKHLVGACAFKAPPADGKVEIGYFTFPDFEGQGVATLMVQQLLDIVRTKSPELTVLAQTENEENASNAILKKIGFTFVSIVNDPEDGELWLWQLTDLNKALQPSPGKPHV
ncbi:GNAT family N-acetyltransferase [Herminiimonas fonticola]|uniref:Acetyltransferase (GNAT) family protein n=1 Tax=Herminiimonas fonticola TaxID=303380 RepID=A0A4R6GHL6_9BURK|nr:GNAT family N-acetyltransferase [Herminiimonas fonticola]RBA24468.1 Acetyltransferase (GNAT) domain [Herminiimonas fonticola]TDN93585.1 acetyltransferase (GNAT) family protein [Herminiimonas fonticola]